MFLLYEDKNSSNSGLVSQADSEFVSFITQTNLSTETNPAPVLYYRLGAEFP